jgi:glycosyltransferase 2 family protein
VKRRWLYYILIFAFLGLVISRFTEAEKLVRTLARGRPEWVVAALLFQGVYYVTFTAVYQSALYTVEVAGSLRELISVWFTSVFLNITAPSVGMTGAAVFIDDAARRGQSAARAAAGTVLVLVADYSAFAVVMIAGMIVLFTTRNLRFYEVLAASILLLFIVALSSVLLLGLARPALLHRLLSWAQRIVVRVAARFHRHSFLPDDWAEHNAAEFSDAAASIKKHPERLARTYATALGAHVAELATLVMLFRAFRVPVHPGVVVAGYSVGILFWLVAITPSGIGVVEGVMTLVLSSLGVHPAAATLIALSFRGLTFWLPLTIGFILLRRSRSFRSASAPKPDCPEETDQRHTLMTL